LFHDDELLSNNTTPPISALYQNPLKDPYSSVSSLTEPGLINEILDLDKVKRDKMINILNFFTKICPFLVIFEGLGHHYAGLPGTGFQRILAPYSYFGVCYIVKLCLLRNYNFVELYGAFILNFALMVGLVEQSIFLNPTNF
jgi:hypothetical protein